MTILNFNLNDVPDLQVSESSEAIVRVTKEPEIKTSNNSGNQYISMMLEVVNEPNTAPIFHIAMLPSEDTDEATKNNYLRRLRDMFEAFGVDYSSGTIDLKALTGKSTWAALKVEEDDEYGRKNRIKRFLGNR